MTARPATAASAPMASVPALPKWTAPAPLLKLLPVELAAVEVPELVPAELLTDVEDAV